MKGDRVEIVIDAGSGTTRTYDVDGHPCRTSGQRSRTAAASSRSPRSPAAERRCAPRGSSPTGCSRSSSTRPPTTRSPTRSPPPALRLASTPAHWTPMRSPRRRNARPGTHDRRAGVRHPGRRCPASASRRRGGRGAPPVPTPRPGRARRSGARRRPRPVAGRPPRPSDAGPTAPSAPRTLRRPPPAASASPP